ncbi:MAG: ABC transporter ATP-binding protein [Hyphomonadaceae bacterium]|nr:MAG: lipoprotein-releasing system ATP-binding protein [Caulobacteraceae bacterium]MBT9444915.1 ABC transporter ATP-binding protein [Hyphomonadaceae bacterium]TPW06921.1 MAG: lipoprotein-releasing system ATP-binding protein [Alphaproteobacteria bacterium]
MSEPALSIRGLERRFASGDGELVILSGVDLDVQPGEMVGLVGPSGSGKSSLLHAAGLLERPTGGTVLIDGVDAWALGDDARTALRRRYIGFVYQFHHLLAEFDALDNVALPQLIAGRRRRDARVEAERLLTLMGLGARLHHQPAQLSGGEQQRVAIARALANRPRLLLADEPTGNLDPTTSGAVFQSLFDVARREGVGALIATHNLELASYMDRVVTLKDGHLVEHARPR